MSEIILVDPKDHAPKNWLSALGPDLIDAVKRLRLKLGIWIWTDDQYPEFPQTFENTFDREWCVLSEPDAKYWPVFLARVFATGTLPWDSKIISSLIAKKVTEQAAITQTPLNAMLVREQERLLQQLKTKLVQKTEERRQELSESYDKIRETQQKLIRINALISSLSQANSFDELNALLREQIPNLLSNSHSLTAADANILDQIREVTSLVFHHKAQLQDAHLLAEEWTKTFDSIDDPIALVDQNLKTIRSNQSFGARTLHDHINSDIRTLVHEALESRKPLTKEIHVSGIEQWYFVRCTPVMMNLRHQPTLAVLHFRDITASRNIRKHILQAEKLTELGVLAGSVAHEINNPLAGILAFIQLMRSSIGSGHPISADLKEMERGALQCRTIVANLLSFSRKANLEEYGLISIHQILETIAPLIQLQLKHEHVQAHFHWNRDAKSYFVHGSFNQFLQILLNLSTLCLEEAKSKGKKIELHWSSSVYREGFYAIELITDTIGDEDRPQFAGTDETLLTMCHYVTLELLKANNGTVEEIRYDDIRGWRLILPENSSKLTTSDQTLRTVRCENSDHP